MPWPTLSACSGPFGSSVASVEMKLSLLGWESTQLEEQNQLGPEPQGFCLAPWNMTLLLTGQ